jgi:hypothetical protein
VRGVFDYFFGKRLELATSRYVEQLAGRATIASRGKASEFLASMRGAQGPKVNLGETEWGEPVELPVEDIVKAHGMVSGGTGSGKTFVGLLIISALLGLLPQLHTASFGVLDAKGELFSGALFLLNRRLEELSKEDPKAARDLRRRVVIVDFSLSDPVSPYNILARWGGADPDFFASSRAELLLDLLPGGDQLSLGASGVLKKLLLLLIEFGLPITSLTDVLSRAEFRAHLLSRCQDRSLVGYFTNQFADVPKSSIAAIHRRIEALFSSESVRLSLAGVSAPDFRAIQDEGRIALINCSGANLSRGVRRLLQGIAMTDIRQSIFARQRSDSSYLWDCDEAQNFFTTEMLRENMADVLTMARSFGSHVLYFTQNLSTAVPDARLLKTLFTNVRWSFSMRGEPSDCAFLKPVLPVSGRKPRPQANPFEEPTFYTLAEERTITHEAIAGLPDRTGYLWFRGKSPEAIKVRTRELSILQGRELMAATLAIRRDPTIGLRLSRREYERLIAERDRNVGPQSTGDLEAKLTGAYQSKRGGGTT